MKWQVQKENRYKKGHKARPRALFIKALELRRLVLSFFVQRSFVFRYKAF